MTFASGEFGVAKCPRRLIQGRCKPLVVGNALVNFHPCGRVVAAAQASWRPGAMHGHRVQQSIYPRSGLVGVNRIDAVINVGVPHLFREGIGQRLQFQHGAIGSLQAQDLGIRAIDLGNGQHIETAGWRRGGIDDCACDLALEVGAV